MALTIVSLAAELRLGDGVTAPAEPVASILTRLMEVASAFVAKSAPLAPGVVKEEATVRFCAYLYDAPTSSGGDRYAAAWRNSGAENLLSRWVIRRTAGST